MQKGRVIRPSDPALSTLDEGFSWEGLDRTGSCGIVLVLVALVWWGEGVWGTEGEALWRLAAADVAWALGEVSKEKDQVAEESSESEEDEHDEQEDAPPRRAVCKRT